MNRRTVDASNAGMTADERRVILASSLGTAFEWYDFFLVGALAGEISKHIFSGVNPQAAFIFTLLSFAAGFAVRPLGAVVFGRLGDLVGRKHTFLVTIVLMGAATFVIGLLPGYGTLGLLAPIIFVGVRMIQGLALGGEYGGAVTYVAEHAPHGKRGAWTSWIQVTASLGLLLALGIILILRLSLGETSFAEWGWRIPFLFSLVLLGISVWIRLKLSESPAFLRMKTEGTLSKAPLAEAFARWRYLRLVLIAFFGLAMGQAVVWYTGQFYSLFFLTQVLKVDGATANVIIVVATIVTAPLYVLFGTLSDRIGRKPLFLAGCTLAVITFFPMYQALTHFANPALEAAQKQSPVVVLADPANCSFQFNPVGTAKFTTSCDIARSSLSKSGLSFDTRTAPPGAVAAIHVGQTVVESYDGTAADANERGKVFTEALAAALKHAGYASKADPAAMNLPMTIVIVVLLMVCGTMTYGPLAAMFVEIFPTRIRYTAMSLPYHVGIGWFGGFLPATTFAIVAATGDIYSGLWYPVGTAAVSAVICLLFMKETRDVDIHAVE